MSPAPSTRPTGITITAWLWMAIGAFMIFSAVMGGFAYSMMRPMDRPSMQAGDLPEFALMNLVFQNFGALLALQCAVALVAIWAGIALLRLKAWARLAIEILCWLGLVWTVGFGIYWAYIWVSMTEQAPSGADTFQVMGVVVAVIATLMFAVPLAIMIWYLRSGDVRQAISQPANTSA